LSCWTWYSFMMLEVTKKFHNIILVLQYGLLSLIWNVSSEKLGCCESLGWVELLREFSYLLFQIWSSCIIACPVLTILLLIWETIVSPDWPTFI
jgi:hypothetical protein